MRSRIQKQVRRLLRHYRSGASASSPISLSSDDEPAPAAQPSLGPVRVLTPTDPVSAERLYIAQVLPNYFSVFSRVAMPQGEFLGFFTHHEPGQVCTEAEENDYNFSASSKCVLVPFRDVSKITHQQRRNHPIACMNEPKKGERATATIVCQDFLVKEVEACPQGSGGGHQPGCRAKYMRGWAMFTCVAVGKDEELTWYYGDAYGPVRQRKGYEAGEECRSVLEGESLGAQNASALLASEIVVRAYATKGLRVPRSCLYPIASSVRRQKRPRSPSPDHEALAYKARLDGRPGRHNRAHGRGAP